MDLMKWRIRKGSGDWWCIYPPSWRTDVYATRTFKDAIVKLVQYQSMYSWERGR